MRSLPLALALLFAGLAWLGASPSVIKTPVIVVFPLTVNGDADKNSGDRLSVLFAQQLADNGVKVVPAPPGTERKDYLTTARALGCDYYVSGFITPLGQEVTVVEQLVSTSSGTVIFSNSAEMVTYSDASGQGQILASAAIRHAGRGLASLGEPPAEATKEPTETNQANLGGLAGLFRRKPRAQATASAGPSETPQPIALSKQAETLVLAPSPVSATLPPAPTPSSAPQRRAAAPSAAPAAVAAAPAGRSGRVVLFEVDGNAGGDARAYARQTLQARLAKGGQTVAAAGPVDPADVIARAADLCSANGAKALVDARLSTRAGDAGYGPSTIAQLDVRAVDCSGHVLFAQHFEHDGTGRHDWQRAVDGVVTAAATPLANAIR